MGTACVYDCRHPWWGGQGTCSRQGDPTFNTCSCDEGYLSEDADGNPACVHRIALVGIYAMVAMYALGASSFLLWQANEQRRLPASVQHGRRAVPRKRLIMAARYCRVSFEVECCGDFVPPSTFHKTPCTAVERGLVTTDIYTTEKILQALCA